MATLYFVWKNAQQFFLVINPLGPLLQRLGPLKTACGYFLYCYKLGSAETHILILSRASFLFAMKEDAFEAASRGHHSLYL